MECASLTSINVDIVDVEDKRLGTLVAVKGYKDADKAKTKSVAR